MNRHLQQRIYDLLTRYDAATLATGGQAGPQISHVAYHVDGTRLHLLLPHNSDHLFNLETQPELVLLTPAWKLYGCGAPSDDIAPLHDWQTVVVVTPTRLHILGADGQSIIETLDF